MRKMKSDEKCLKHSSVKLVMARTCKLKHSDQKLLK